MWPRPHVGTWKTPGSTPAFLNEDPVEQCSTWFCVLRLENVLSRSLRLRSPFRFCDMWSGSQEDLARLCLWARPWLGGPHGRTSPLLRAVSTPENPGLMEV